MELIDKNSLKNKCYQNYFPQGNLVVNWEDINNSPIIEAEPIKTGNWILVDSGDYYCGIYVCSNCNNKTLNAIVNDSKGEIHSMLYCPHCGAKMLGEVKYE